MRRSHFEAFAPICPVCARAGRGDNALELAVVGAEGAHGVQAGILHCSAAVCRHEYPIIDGLPIIVPELRRLMAERGVEIMLRTDIDPVLESLIGDAIGPDSWFDATRQMLSTYGWDAYADLDPEEVGARGAPAPGAARHCLDRLLALAGSVAEPAHALDLGCAAGRTSFSLASHFGGALVLGVDMHLALLRLARGAAAGHVSYSRRRSGLAYDRRSFAVDLAGAERVDFWACDAAALPMRTGTIDLAVALNLLDCVPDPRALLAEIARVLRPGAQALLATPYDWSPRATPVENWLGGHSQRGAQAGDPAAFLHALLGVAPGFSVRGEQASHPWHTRLHDRSHVQYATHLLALNRNE